MPPVSIDDAAPLEGDDDGNGHADPKRYSRAALFGVIAAREAWRDAGLRAGEPNAGVLIGSGGGGIDVGEKQYEDFFTSGGRHVTPYAIAVGICGMVSSEISIALRLHGLSHVLSCGCTSSTDAIGYAASLIRSGEYDMLLSGGTDGCVLPGMIFGFSRMRAVSTHYNDRPAEASRPFDRGRDGFVLGEGAWMFVLEREDRALARGATRYARIEGYASTCDAYHRVQMDPDGVEIVRCIETAARARAPASRGDRLRQLPRHLDAVERRDRVALRAARLRPPCRRGARVVDEVDDRPSAGGERRGRRGGHRDGADARRAAADDQPRRPGSGVRHGFHSEHRARRRGRRRALQLSRVRIQEQRAGPRARPMTPALVVGAGPAGTVAALVLARAGVHVRLVDRAEFPRDKLCGDTLNPGALSILDRLGLGDRVRARAVPIAGMIVTGPTASRVACDYPDGLCRRRDRPQGSRRDARGRRHCGRCRLRARPCRVRGPLDDERLARDRRADRRAASSSMPARVVIAADGRRSTLAFALGLTRFRRRAEALGVRRVLH